MRMQRLRDVTLPRIRTQDQTADPRPIPKLRPLIIRHGTSKLPSLNVRRVHMIIPSTPVIPSNENRNLRPQSPLHHRVNLVDSPPHTLRHIAHRALSRIRRMLVKLARRVNPRDTRQLPRTSIRLKPVTGKLPPTTKTAQILK